MEIIPAAFQIENKLAAQNASNVADGQLDRDAFLNLLLAQLQNQDPLSPLQDHEFVAQLATFSSLEQLEGINTSLDASLLMNQSVNNSLATNLIGKEILADGSQLTLGEEGKTSFQIDLADEADVTILIRDERGALVKRIDAGRLAAGDSPLEWDGTDDNGNRLAAGTYTLEATTSDSDGKAVASSLKVRALVTGVRFEGGNGFLMLGDQIVPLSSVQEVFQSATS